MRPEQRGQDARPLGARACSRDGPACGWTPSALPGLVLWLDAGFGVPAGADQTVSAWRDRSGHDNDATPGSGQLRPVLATAANGRPMIFFRSFDGTGGAHLTIPDAPTLPFATGP